MTQSRRKGFKFVDKNREDYLSVQYHCVLVIDCKLYIGSGGGQLRTIREVYHFITGQLKALEQGLENVFFANILDGDSFDKHMRQFF